MKVPDWRQLTLDEGILKEPIPDDDRIVFWLPANGESERPHWERISSLPRAPISLEQGICATPATLLRARQQERGLLGKLWSRFRREDGAAQVWVLPNGASAEQCGNRQTDLVLAWAEDEANPPDDARMRSRFPTSNRLQKIAANLFLVSGVKPAVPKAAPPPVTAQGCPKAQAEQILAEARQSGNKHAEAAALTDLAAVFLHSKDVPQAVAHLEQAVTLARQIGDRPVEADALGNLGLALLTTGQVPQAQQVLAQTLVYAREAADPVAQKLSLERLGVACSRLRDHAQAFACFEEALTLARRLGDRKHEGELLWYLAIEYAETGQRDQAISQARAAIDVLTQLRRPEAGNLASDLRQYEQQESAAWPVAPGAAGPAGPADAFAGGSFVVSASAVPDTASAGKPTSGPALLRMALSAARAMSHYLASGMKAVPPDTHRRRLEVCTGCDQHTGLRCRVCGCFTNVKAWLPHEDCPLGKWPARS
jgi:tetratricopeptide (TPR) repeat protein